MKKKLLSMSLALCMVFGSVSALPQSYIADNTSISASADTLIKYPSYNYYYKVLSDGTVAITSFYNKTKSAINVVVPSTIAGRKVSTIDSSAFWGELIAAVTIPEGVTTINGSAFRSSTATSISIPSTVTKINNNAFNACDKLQKIVVSSANKNYSSANGALLSKDGTQLIYVPSGVVNYTIPTGVKIVEQYAIHNNNKLQTLNMSDSVTTFKAYSIEYNPALRTINFGAGVSSLGGFSTTGTTSAGEFYHGLDKFAEINVSASNKTFASYDGALYNKAKTILLRCPEHKSKITIAASTITLGNYSFWKNKALTSVYVPNSVKTIDGSAFINATALKSVILPYGLTTINAGTFEGCTSLASISIPSTVKSIKGFAFYGCKSLTSVVIPGSVTDINGNAFTGCTALKDLYIPSSVTTIYESSLGTNCRPVIYGKKSSKAESIAKAKNLTFKEISQPFYRYAGAGRYDTAKTISVEGIGATNKTVVLAYGLNYADALAGVPLASKLNAPILLTTKDALPAETLGEIKRRGATTVYILGGEGAIAPNVANVLKKNNITVKRIAGSTRFGTATKIAKEVNSAPTEIFFVYGFNYADALSVSAVAALKKAPIIYLNKDGSIDADTANYLKSVKGKVKNAYVIGGEGVISSAMMNKAASALGLKAGSTIRRIYGANRYSTCIAVNKSFQGLFTGNAVCVATGTDFPDALAGGVLAAKKKSPLLLANSSLSTEQKSYLKSKKPSQIIAFGGTSAVPNSLIQLIGASSK